MRWSGRWNVIESLWEDKHSDSSVASTQESDPRCYSCSGATDQHILLYQHTSIPAGFHPCQRATAIACYIIDCRTLQSISIWAITVMMIESICKIASIFFIFSTYLVFFIFFSFFLGFLVIHSSNTVSFQLLEKRYGWVFAPTNNSLVIIRILAI